MHKQNKVLVLSKRKDKAATEVKGKLLQWLEKKKIEVLDVSDSDDLVPDSELKKIQLGIVIGGDGTFLTLVRRLEKKETIPILGINLGSLGFITEFSKEEMLTVVEAALQGKLKEQKRCLLRVEICQENHCRISGLVFNDAVITKDARTPMLKFHISLNQEHLNYIRADGYIISTPTGSTAYNLSAGGPLLHPEVEGLVLVPLCSHALSSRPIVIPLNQAVHITPEEFLGAVYLVLDGQISHELSPNDEVRISPSGSYLRLLCSEKLTWFKALKSKLDMV